MRAKSITTTKGDLLNYLNFYYLKFNTCNYPAPANLLNRIRKNNEGIVDIIHLTDVC